MQDSIVNKVERKYLKHTFNEHSNDQEEIEFIFKAILAEMKNA